MSLQKTSPWSPWSRWKIYILQLFRWFFSLPPVGTNFVHMGFPTKGFGRLHTCQVRGMTPRNPSSTHQQGNIKFIWYLTPKKRLLRFCKPIHGYLSIELLKTEKHVEICARFHSILVRKEQTLVWFKIEFCYSIWPDKKKHPDHCHYCSFPPYKSSFFSDKKNKAHFMSRNHPLKKKKKHLIHIPL